MTSTLDLEFDPEASQVFQQVRQLKAEGVLGEYCMVVTYEF